MNVLIIAQLFPPDMGGGATRAYNVAKGLLEAGCNVTVISAFPHYPSGNIPSQYRWKPLFIEYKERLRIIRTFVPPLSSKGYGRRILLFFSFILSSLLALPLTRKADIIWAANPNITATITGVFYRIFKRCPLVENVDDLWPEALYDLGISPKSTIARIGKFLTRLAYNTSSAITPISPAYVNVIHRKYQISRDKIHVVRAGVDLERFQLQPTLKANQKFSVLYIGAFSPAYNFNQIFEAAKILSSDNKIEFVIQGDGELAEMLIKKSKTSTANVKVVKKIIPRDEVARIMSNASALILPLSGKGSIELGISSKLYEYQASGKPILCISSGQPGKYISKSKSGIVITPGDFQELVEAINSLNKNPQLAKSLGENGRKYVETHLTIQAIGHKMKELFKTLRKV